MVDFGIPAEQYAQQNRFGTNEVGLNHPSVPGFIRICDTGDVEIVAGEGVSIVLSPGSRSITFTADTIKLLTKNDGGLRWNKVAFNSRATGFNEPTFITIDEELDIKNIYRGVNYFIDTVPTGLKIRDPDSGEEISLDEYAQRFGKPASKYGAVKGTLNPLYLEDI